MEACCTCATLLTIVDLQTEKPRTLDRRLDCCGRIVCRACMHETPRFKTYCLFCQISLGPSPLPQGLRDPPSYNAASAPACSRSAPPAYEQADALPPYNAGSSESQVPPLRQEAGDVLHFLEHSSDTMTSLSFRYGVPIAALRKANNITSDHLLSARRTVVIPGDFYNGGVSLSPRPIGEEAGILTHLCASSNRRNNLR